MTVKELMIEHALTEAEATELYIEQESERFDRWKDKAKEEGTYYNPLVKRDA